MIPATILPNPNLRPSRAGRWLWFCFFVVVLGTFVFRNLGLWLDREDPLQKAAAIAVLSGRMPDRALEAARLIRHGIIHNALAFALTVKGLY